MIARPRNLTLCADDFGQSKDISEGILDLIACRRLTATSVLTEGPFWPEGAHRLRDLQDRADVGVHLNLTHAFPQTSGNRPLIHWLIATQAGRVMSDTIKDRFVRQIDLFVQHFRRLPDFVDGHQHVHAFPLIRQAMVDAIELRWANVKQRPWVRTPDRLIDDGGSRLKAFILRYASRGFSDFIQQHGLKTTEHFGGLYALNVNAHFETRMRHWLQLTPSGTLLMCHPGRTSTDYSDPIGSARAAEFSYLVSPRFYEDCQRNSIRLVRFSH
jgi:predicted glycoside hydrolase/deacetylase ChbG (UPF0249 family)